MKKINNLEKNDFVIEKPVEIGLKNVNIEIFKGVAKNGKPIIQKLKPVETLKKRSIELNGIPFNKIREAIVTIQNEEKRLNNEAYFEEFDRKLIKLKQKLNDRRENYKWYNYLFKSFNYKIDFNSQNN